MSKEEAERRAEQERQNPKESKEVSAHNNLHHHHIPEKSSMDGKIEVPPHSPRNDKEVEKTLSEAEKSVDKQTGKKGRRRSEEEKPERTLGTHTNDARVSTTLPIVQEVGENSSRHSSRRGKDSPEGKRESEAVEDAENSAVRTMPSTETQGPKTVEYTVKDDDLHLHSLKKEEEGHTTAPLDDQAVEDEDDKRRRSKPPRIESGIIPTMTPLYREDEIGIAK